MRRKLSLLNISYTKVMNTTESVIVSFKCIWINHIVLKILNFSKLSLTTSFPNA